MQKFVRTLLLLAVFALPFATQAQTATADREYLSPEGFSVANPEGWLGGTAAYSASFAPAADVLPSWTYAQYSVNGLEAGHYYYNLFAQNQYRWLITPEINLAESGEAKLQFDMALTPFDAAEVTVPDTALDEGKRVMVLIQTKNANGTWGNWTTLASWTKESLTDSLLSTIPNTYRTYTYDLANYLDKTVRVAFYAENTSLRKGSVNLHLDNVSVTGKVKCLPVQSLVASDVAVDGLTFSWVDTVNPVVLQYVVRLYEGNAVVDSLKVGADVTVAASSSRAYTYTFSGLNAATRYTVAVVAYADANTASTAATFTAMTHYNTVALPYTNNFDADNALDGWHFVNGGNGWYRSLEPDTTGDMYTLWISNDSGANNTATNSSNYAWAYVPVNLEAGSYDLTFDWRNGFSSSYNHYLRVYLVPETATITNSSASNDWISLGGVLNNSAEWTSAFFPIDIEEAGIYHLAFLYYGYTNLTPAAAIDNISFGARTCFAVENLVAEPTRSTIALTWDDANNDGATYAIQCFAAGDTLPMWYNVAAGETSYTITGLEPSTAYNLTIYTICGGDTARLNAQVSTTTTCPQTATLACASYTVALVDSYGDGWNGGSLRLMADGNLLGTYTISDGSSANYNVELCAGQSVDLMYASGSYSSENSYSLLGPDGSTIYSHGSESNTSGYTTRFSFVPDSVVVCVNPEPINPTFSERTGNSAVISWTNPLIEDADHYEVSVALEGEVVFEANDITDLSVEATGLNHSTEYMAYVKAVYADGISYEDSASFMTMEPCNGPANIVLTPARASIDMTWEQEDVSINTYELVVSTTELDAEGLAAAEVTTVVIEEGAKNHYVIENLERGTDYYIYFRSRCSETVTSLWQSAQATTGVLTDCGNPVLADGTATNNYVPIYGYYADNYQRSQFIYPASLIAEAGIPVGASITSMTFYLSQTSVNLTSTFQANIMETEATTLSSFLSGATNVYESTVTIANNQMVIDFNAPYVYNGGNLLVEFKGITKGNYSQTSFYGISADGASVSGNNYSSVEAVSASARNFMPKVSIAYCLIFEACPQVTDLVAEPDITTATISWTAADADYLDGYQYVILPATEAAPAADAQASTIDKSETSFTLEGLTGGTDYVFYIRSLCAADNDTSDWASVAFQTLEQCRVPANIVVVLDGKNSAVATWENTGRVIDQADNFEYFYTTDTLTAEELEAYTGDVYTVADTTVAINGLAYETTYNLYVRAACGDELHSKWVAATSTFTTGKQMPAVINLAGVANHSTINVSWESDTANFANETEWQIAICTADDSADLVWNTINHRDTLFIGLENETTYKVFVKAVDGDDESAVDSIEVTTSVLPSNCVLTASSETGTGTNMYVPTNAYYNYSITETLVKASELGARTLTGISYNYAGTSNFTRNVAIYLMPTTKTSFASSADVVNIDATAVKVFDGSRTFTPGWNTFEFTAPYEYDASSDLMVIFDDNTGSYSNQYPFYVENAADNLTIYQYQDNNNYDPTNIVIGGSYTRGVLQGRPVMQFCFVRNSTCFEPSALVAENVTSSSADISWLPGNQESAWEYVYSTEQLDAEALADAVAQTTSTVNVSLAGLDRDADYYFYVRGVCDDTTKSDWSKLHFVTDFDCSVPVKLAAREATTSSVLLTAQAGEKGEPADMTFAYWKKGFASERTEVTAELVEDINAIFDGLVAIDSALVDDEMVYTYDSTFVYDTNTYYGITIEGLEPTTAYYFVAAANCGSEDGISRWSDSVEFSTLCDGFVTLPFEEGFEDNSLTADCWTVVINDEMELEPVVSFGCIYPFVDAPSGSTIDRYIISPEFESTDSVLLASYLYTGYSSTPCRLAVGYSTTDNDTASFVWLDTNYYSNTWANKFVPAGTKYVAYHFIGTTSYYNPYIGDANIRELKQFNVVAATGDAEIGNVMIVKNNVDTLPMATSYDESIYEFTNVKIVAVPNEGHHLTHWTRGAAADTLRSPAGVVITNSTITIGSLAADTNLTAYFAIDPYTLHVSENNANYGYAKIVVDEDTIIRDTNNYYGTPITVEAFDTVANDTYSFRGWSKTNNVNNIVSYENPYSFTMDGSYTLTAMFVIDSFNVAATVNDTNMGVVTGQGNYPYGTASIHMAAEPKYGHEFVKWTGANEFETEELSFDTAVVDNQPMAFNAVFQKIPFYLQLTSNDPTKGTASSDVNEGLYMAPMVLTATATAEHYHFQYWSDGTNENPYNFFITQDTNMIAFFAIDTHKVELAAREDMGTVAINGEDTNLMWFNYGTQAISIEATPNTGVQFVKWMNGDEEVSTLNPYTIETLENDLQLTAVFDSIVYDVVFNINDVEGNVVDLEENELANQTVLNGRYGDILTLVMDNANAGFRFNNWTDAEGNVYAGDTINYAINANVEQWIRANFVEAGKINVNVSVNIANAGTAVIEGTRTVAGVPTDTTSLYGNDRFDSLSTITMIATPAEHYHFIGWTVNNEELSANLTETIDSIGNDGIVTLNVVALFEIDTHYVTAVAENGSFKFNGAAAEGIYAQYGSNVNINALPADHYHFLAWEDGNTNADTTVTVDGDIELTAEFELDTNAVIFAVNNELFGTVIPTGYKSLEGENTAWYTFGDSATLTAVANTGYHFVKWSNEATNATYSFPVFGTLNYTATFDTNVYNVATTVESEEMGTIEGPATVKHFTSNTYVAVANTGYHFVNWTTVDGTELGTTDTLVLANPVSDTALVANFDYNSYTVSAAVAEGCENMGSVAGDTTANYLSSVQLYATAAEGYHLVSWSNGATTDTITVTVPAEDITYTATFAINTYTVTANVNDAAMGSVNGAQVTEHGAVNTLVAVANYGYHFTGWSNGVETDTMALTVVSDTTVVANFAKNQYTANVAVNDATMGTALRSNGTPLYLDSVTFTASANQHYRFVNWSNGDTNSTIKIQITKDTTMTANFEAIMFTVHSSVNDATMGTVTPAGDSTVLEGQQIVYVATPAEGYQFKNWSTGETTTTITVTVNGNMNIVANFEPIPITYYSITVQAASPSMGTVSGSNSNVAEGTEVTVSATAAAGYRFTGWMEGNTIVSTDNPYTFVVTGNRTLVAQFIAVYTVTVQSSDNTMGTVSPVNATYDEGETAVVEAQANEGYHFVAWVNANNSNDTISRNARYEFTVNANVNLIGVFAADPTGIDDVDMSNVIIYSADSKIYVRGAENRSIYVFDVNGRMVANEANATEIAEFRMSSTGVYLVKVGNAPAKRVLVVR